MENIKELIGKEASNYFGEKGVILDAAKLSDWKNLKKYDNTGWMNEIEFKELELTEDTILVAFENTENSDEPIDVYVFGDEGVSLLN